MSLEDKAEKLYKEGVIIPCCCVSYRDFVEGRRDTVDIRIGEEWLYDFKPPIKEYMNYSHTFSQKVIDNYNTKK